ncbi:MAG: ASPIC/UnbV domain-containing protein, partial [Rubripirellula sp.]
GGDGFLCSNQNQLHFGTGATKLVESLRVRWPSGTEQIFEAVKTNQSYLLIEGQDELVTRE